MYTKGCQKPSFLPASKVDRLLSRESKILKLAGKREGGKRERWGGGRMTNLIFISGSSVVNLKYVNKLSDTPAFNRWSLTPLSLCMSQI